MADTHCPSLPVAVPSPRDRETESQRDGATCSPSCSRSAAERFCPPDNTPPSPRSGHETQESRHPQCPHSTPHTAIQAEKRTQESQPEHAPAHTATPCQRLAQATLYISFQNSHRGKGEEGAHRNPTPPAQREYRSQAPPDQHWLKAGLMTPAGTWKTVLEAVPAEWEGSSHGTS